MPRILAGDEYVQLAAYYREQMKHALPETAHLDVQLVPVYDGYSLAEITSEPEVLWQLLGVENFHIFLKIDEVSEEGAVRIRCSNRIAYQSRINTKAFTSDCERLLAQMCQKSVKVETCFKEDETLAPVPDDYFGRRSSGRRCARKRKRRAIAPRPSATAAKATVLQAACRAGGVLKGKLIKAPVVAVSEIEDEKKSVCLAGTIFSLDSRELKSGRSLIMFSLTDHTDSIDCKVFADKDEADTLKTALKEAKAIKVRGKVQYDNYSNELGMIVNDINQATLACRIDNAPEKRVELASAHADEQHGRHERHQGPDQAGGAARPQGPSL